MLRRFRSTLIVLTVLALAACGEGVVKRVSEPASSLQQLTVNADGSWKVALRLQNFSSMPMRFDDIALKLSVGDAEAGTLTAKPGVSIGGASADVIELQLQPAAQARLIVADALASNHTLAYTLEGSVAATPEEKKQRTFQINNRSTLNHAPGLPGVLR
ncbi:LEA type 2 family protein [Stenotrophomonas sp. SORGH_AS_0321]|uniref:NDR1/HIN1-like protein n=1 Tax=Stenotrophomonas sp. SORGH_AS_0321 TaxID=3041787 RepID=UPI00285F5CEA|nr:LEA type 2 family protein [Stenotrophomonas sp. SORGH_AS_0321]MDR6094048.1 ABC-type phosphate transport system substrate-binding protein [Stenotrophomonas sp. SORGH_AS_0321]